MTKLEKIGADLKRARAKQAVWAQRVKELESRYREEENSVIHTMNGSRGESDARAAGEGDCFGRARYGWRLPCGDR